MAESAESSGLRPTDESLQRKGTEPILSKKGVTITWPWIVSSVLGSGLLGHVFGNSITNETPEVLSRIVKIESQMDSVRADIADMRQFMNRFYHP